MKRADPTNPFHRASFWVEEMKYGSGERKVEMVPVAEIEQQVETLLRDLGLLTKVSPDQVVSAMHFYGRSFSEILGIPEIAALSVFVDGVLHGLALAAGKEAEPPK